MQQLEAQKTSNKIPKSTKHSSPGTTKLVNVDATINTHDSNEVAPKENLPIGMDGPKRPVGKKKAKDSLRRGGSEVYIEALDVLWAKKKEADLEKEIKKEERYAKTFALDQERLELDKKRLANEEKKLANDQQKLANEANNLQIQKMAKEERIMSMGTSLMNDLQREYYISLQAEVMSRRMSNSY
ncbi:hypothetical protein QOZ80_3BG0279980 [Eleusine coracana subsp. coracana]|nr:hypothetical protein QOZ80_3BG0279980 [Eleusine coracana subsp. coracana]